MSEESVDLAPQDDADASPEGYVDRSIDTSVPVETAEEPVEVETEPGDDAEEMESEVDSSPADEENVDETIDTEGDDEEKFSDNVKSRIDELTSKWRDTERNLAAVAQENEALRKQIAEQPVEVEPFKSAAEFETEAEYQHYMATEVERRAVAAAEKVSAGRESEGAQQKAYNEFFAKEKEFAAEVKDYHKVIGDPNLKISPDMAYATQVTMQDPGMVYYLANNQDVAERLFSMPRDSMLVELGKIKANQSAEKAKAKSTKKVSDALPPVRKVKGGDPGRVKRIDDASLTDAQFKKMREKQIANR